ncbi:DUF6950 family protein [Marinovum sp.]|uniref:DUF6950 family protein n=1 Tax=Marinovum sp. TaxID=2024839 RepID=UPI002B273E86|nr:hypothetical protein [Marinovum sp.]
MNLLSLTLQRWAARPHVWGQDDCILAPLDWVSAVLGGPDLAADLRLTYEDFTSAQKAYRFFTDPLPLAVDYLERRAGLSRVAVPGRGDVALFKHPGQGGRILPTAGICVAPHLFACRADPGVLAARPANVMAAWGVGYADQAVA